MSGGKRTGYFFFSFEQKPDIFRGAWKNTRGSIKMNLRNTICGAALFLLFFSAGQTRAEGGINNMDTIGGADEIRCAAIGCERGGLHDLIMGGLYSLTSPYETGVAIPDNGAPFGRGINIEINTNTLIRTNINTIPPADGPL